MQKNTIWIAWEDDGSIRSRVMSKAFGAKFYTFTAFEGNSRLSVLRYPAAMLQTFWALISQKPSVLFVQNPSVVLSFFAAFLKPFLNYKLIIDLHTHYIHFKGFKGSLLRFLNHYSLKRANIVIVTNASYRAKIKTVTHKDIFILPDKIPGFDYKFEPLPLKGSKNILFICTFSPDEPWQEVISAVRMLDKDVCVYISGRPKISCDLENVVLTGFLPDQDYQNLLRSVDAVMVLTDQEDCMVCGAYEGVSAQKPLILSDQKVLKAYFNQGSVFTQNNSEKIAKALTFVLKNINRLTKDIQVLKQMRMQEWEEKQKQLLKILTTFN